MSLMSSPQQGLSLQAEVFQYFRDHPKVLKMSKRGCNTMLYNAFGAVLDSERKKLRIYKQRFLAHQEKVIEAERRQNVILSKLDEKYVTHDIDDVLKRKNKSKYDLIAVLPKAKWQSFKEFVGYVDADGVEYRGEAIPEPEDQDTGEYKGILWYQEEGFHIIEDHDNILILWPRGHGKTWLLAWWIEWNMKHSRFKCMYLSITDVINDVADWVFEWADANKVLAEGSNIERRMRPNTPKKFKLVNESVFRIFYVKDRNIRGKHDYTIIMDDIIEEGSERQPTYQADLKRRWNATISKVRRDKLVIVNTRVYEGDFIEEMISMFQKKHDIMLKRRPEMVDKWSLYTDIKTPYRWAKEGDLADTDGFLLGEDGRRVLIAPELYTHEHFEAMEAEDYGSFMSEMMQNPTSIEGGMVTPDDILYVKRPHFSEGVQMVGVGVDLSWSESEHSDMCAIVSCVSATEVLDKKAYKRFTFVRSDVDAQMPMFDKALPNGRVIDGIFTIIGKHAAELLHLYPRMPLIIAIERNAGGMIIINVAIREKFWWLKYVIADHNVAIKWSKEGKSNVPLGITHKTAKIPRVFGELQRSIKIHETRFDWILEATMFMAQVLAFPKGKYDDGPDAGGMAKDELNRRWHVHVVRKKQQGFMEKIRERNIKKRFKQSGEPWLAVQEAAFKKQQRERKTI